MVCHLRSLEEFGRQAFPRGSMLGGRLEAAKEPGHFWGKGNLKITFDRVILPNGDYPVPAKIIAAKGLRVDKKGDIDGKGHAKRDVAEWMFPPLWPWKIVMLPARGPRPTLKGEEPLQLRLMDDLVIPRTLAYGPSGDPNRPPYATPFQSSAATMGKQLSRPQLAVEKRVVSGGEAETQLTTGASGEVTTLVLRTLEVYVVNKYRIDGDVLLFRQVDGAKGVVDVSQVDWRKTWELTEAARSVGMPTMAWQIN